MADPVQIETPSTLAEIIETRDALLRRVEIIRASCPEPGHCSAVMQRDLEALNRLRGEIAELDAMEGALRCSG